MRVGHYLFAIFILQASALIFGMELRADIICDFQSPVYKQTVPFSGRVSSNWIGLPVRREGGMLIVQMFTLYYTGSHGMGR